MKNLFTLAAVLTIFMGISNASADEYVSRVSCGGTQFVIEGLHTYNDGFTKQQVVIRDANAVQYLSKLSGFAAKANARGEIVIPLSTNKFDGTFSADLGTVYPNGSSGGGGSRYTLVGFYQYNGLYEVQVKRLSVYPGMTYHEASFEGNWVFHNCK